MPLDRPEEPNEDSTKSPRQQSGVIENFAEVDLSQSIHIREHETPAVEVNVYKDEYNAEYMDVSPIETEHEGDMNIMGEGRRVGGEGSISP